MTALPQFRIEGTIGEQPATAEAVAEFLARRPGRSVEIIVNSGGGNAFEGAAIMAEIERHGRVTGRVHGIAASAASLLLMGCARIVMHSEAMLMVHDPSGATFGPADLHRRTAAVLDQLSATYAAGYARRTGLPEKQVRQLMRDETWLTAADAAALGFADEIDMADDRRQAVARFDYAAYRNAPPQLVAKARENGWAAVTPEAIQEGAMALDNEQEPGREPEGEAATMTAAATRTERARVRRILEATAVAKLPREFADDLIEKGTPIEASLDAITAAWKEKGGDDAPTVHRPTARILADHDGPKALAEKMGDALAARVSERLGFDYEPTSGRAYLSMSVADMVGVGRAFTMASHSTSDFPLGLGLSAVVARGHERAMPGIQRLARRIEAVDYRSGNAVGLDGVSKMMPVGEGGEVKFGTLDERGEAKAVPTDRAVMWRLSNHLLVNDAVALGLLADVARVAIQSAVSTTRDVLLEPLLANSGAGQTMRDGAALFHASHGNLAGSGAAPDVTPLSNARTAMARQKDSQGAPLAIEPRFLLVPPELQTTAEKLVATLAPAQTANVNPFSQRLEVIVEPGLSSATAWYLVADPEMAEGLAYAVLDDVPAPRIETRDAWPNLGLEMRLHWPLGAAFHDYRAWHRNPGA